VNRSFKYPAVLAIIFAFGLFSGAAYGKNLTAGQGEAPYFSDKDIEEYKMPSDNKTPDVIMNRTKTKEEKGREKKEQQEQENWCKRANSYKRKMEKARDEVSEAEKELSSEKMCRKKRIALEKKLKKAQKQCTYAERDFADLEDEAHRKGIPPGWLRCQFE
jgi:hypothetical protein